MSSQQSSKSDKASLSEKPEAPGQQDVDAAEDSDSVTALDRPFIEFKPFFTLIEDLQTGEHHHPDVYYIFEDDDPDVLVSATLAAIDSQSDAAGATLPLGEEERVLILDVAANGKAIENISSLSPHWQAISAAIAPAPSWAETTTDAERGLMLTISGQEAPPERASRSRPASNLDALAKEFEQRLEELRAVLGTHQARNQFAT